MPAAFFGTRDSMPHRSRTLNSPRVWAVQAFITDLAQSGGLFDAVIQDYMETILRPRLNLLHSPTAPAEGISTFVKSLSDALGKTAEGTTNRGCLLLNTAVGTAGNDEASDRWMPERVAR